MYCAVNCIWGWGRIAKVCYKKLVTNILLLLILTHCLLKCLGRHICLFAFYKTPQHWLTEAWCHHMVSQIWINIVSGIGKLLSASEWHFQTNLSHQSAMNHNQKMILSLIIFHIGTNEIFFLRVQLSVIDQHWNRRQADTWSNDDLIYFNVYMCPPASLELVKSTKCYQCLVDYFNVINVRIRCNSLHIVGQVDIQIFCGQFDIQICLCIVLLKQISFGVGMA